MKAGLLPAFILVLAAFLLLEFKIFDILVHRSATGLPQGSKHLLIALTVPLLVPLAGWQAYRNLKDDLPNDSNTPIVLFVVKKHLLSLICMALVTTVLLLEWF
jgi:hypothetical protein